MSRLSFITPVGRIVQGGMGNPKTVDDLGQLLLYKSGANIGQSRVEFYFGLAIPKTDPGLAAVMDVLGQAAMASWPGGENALPGFSWKFIDGDGVDAKGVSYSTREGFAGCTILKFTGSFAPKCSVRTSPGNWMEINPDTIKTGDYIIVAGSTDGNNSKQSPGIYLNYDRIEHVGIGEAIIAGPTAADAFGTTPAAVLPAGATVVPAPEAAPVAGAMPGPPGPPAATPRAHVTVAGIPAGTPVPAAAGTPVPAAAGTPVPAAAGTPAAGPPGTPATPAAGPPGTPATPAAGPPATPAAGPPGTPATPAAGTPATPAAGPPGTPATPAQNPAFATPPV